MNSEDKKDVIVLTIFVSAIIILIILAVICSALGIV